MSDPRTPDQITEDRKQEFAAENEKLAATYSAPGSLKNAMLRLGFMPDSDAVAFGILKNIVEENERLRDRLGLD